MDILDPVKVKIAKDKYELLKGSYGFRTVPEVINYTFQLLSDIQTYKVSDINTFLHTNGDILILLFGKTYSIEILIVANKTVDITIKDFDDNVIKQNSDMSLREAKRTLKSDSKYLIL